MSTRCSIIVKTFNNSHVYYSHYDGYPNGVGKDLIKLILTARNNWNSEKSIFVTFEDSYEPIECVTGDSEYVYVITYNYVDNIIEYKCISRDLNSDKTDDDFLHLFYDDPAIKEYIRFFGDSDIDIIREYNDINEIKNDISDLSDSDDVNINDKFKSFADMTFKENMSYDEYLNNLKLYTKYKNS